MCAFAANLLVRPAASTLALLGAGDRAFAHVSARLAIRLLYHARAGRAVRSTVSASWPTHPLRRPRRLLGLGPRVHRGPHVCAPSWAPGILFCAFSEM